MKLNTELREYESNNVNVNKAFTIEASAKAFQILSGNLYSDRPLAIVRELICNAWDAHVVAGTTDTPIRVSLPNFNAPEFVVRDYGTGLSHDAVIGLYTTYFGSNKTHTNDLIGGLGLGSKSPFSYTDQFNVTSFYNNQKRTYTAFIGEDGTPQITQLGGAEITDEPNGMRISVPVNNPSDFRTFRDKAIEFVSWMPVCPIINVEAATIPDHTPKTVINLSGGKQFWYQHLKANDAHIYGYGNSFLIRQGLVNYPVSRSTAQEIAAVGNRLKWEAHLTRGVFVVPVGTFDIAPSREELSLSQAQKQTLRNLMEEATNEIVAEAKALLASAGTLFEAYVTYNRLSAAFDSDQPPTWTNPVTKQEYSLREAYAGIPCVHFDTKLLTVSALDITPASYRSKKSGSTIRSSLREGSRWGHMIGRSRNDGEFPYVPKIFWAPKKKPFRHVVDEYAKTSTRPHETAFAFFGDKAEFLRVLSTIGLTDYEEIPDYVRTPAARAARKKQEPLKVRNLSEATNGETITVEEFEKLIAGEGVRVTIISPPVGYEPSWAETLQILSNIDSKFSCATHIAEIPRANKRLRRQLKEHENVFETADELRDYMLRDLAVLTKLWGTRHLYESLEVSHQREMRALRELGKLVPELEMPTIRALLPTDNIPEPHYENGFLEKWASEKLVPEQQEAFNKQRASMKAGIQRELATVKAWFPMLKLFSVQLNNDEYARFYVRTMVEKQLKKEQDSE
jgi:hypothetical protein